MYRYLTKVQCVSVVVGDLRRELKIPIWGRWEENSYIYVNFLKYEYKLQLGNEVGVASHYLRFHKFYSKEYIKIQNIQGYKIS